MVDLHKKKDKWTGDGSRQVGPHRLADPRSIKVNLSRRAKRIPITLPKIGEKK